MSCTINHDWYSFDEYKYLVTRPIKRQQHYLLKYKDEILKEYFHYMTITKYCSWFGYLHMNADLH